MMRYWRCTTLLGLSWLLACGPASTPEPTQPQGTFAPAPWILLITLDTTRADVLGYAGGDAETPHLDALAARGVRFSRAFSTVPTTLPAHTSMFTGLYPAEHRVHENARPVSDEQSLAADLLRKRGYTTAAFVSGFPLAEQFGLARGFDHYDDDFAATAAERRAVDTTDRALAYLDRSGGNPHFLWVHYFDPHEPYDPPSPFAERIADPYLAEIAAMDEQIGRLLRAFEERAGEAGFKVLVAGDHGEGLGDHGENLHGNLLYQGVMRVPMLAAGSGIAPAEETRPVSIRQIFDTLLAWAGDGSRRGLLDAEPETVLGEAMKPHLQYGWQPQVMAVQGQLKIIQSGDTEIYDLATDPDETQNLAGEIQIPSELRDALRAYPRRPKAAVSPNSSGVSQQDRERLASLGYVDWEGQAPLRDDAPNPRDMTHLFDALDRGSGLFVEGRYDAAIEVFEGVLEADPENLMVAVRLAVAHSLTDRERRALELFERARQIDPSSIDVRHYQAMHHLRFGDQVKAEPLLASVLAQMPSRLPALRGMARIRARQGRLDEAQDLMSKAVELDDSHLESVVELGKLSMGIGDTPSAIYAFERARDLAGDRFEQALELGVLYLAEQRIAEAAESLDRIPPSHPGYPMALFKRAQASVLLSEPDSESRIRAAYRAADATTRPLIENEALFRGVALR